MSERVYLNNDWKFSEKCDTQMVREDYDDSEMSVVRIPHTCKEIPFNYFSEEIYQMVSLYRRSILVPEEWREKNIILTFEGVAHGSEVFLNGEIIDSHNCGYTAFSIDISSHIRYGEENILAVRVDSRENLDFPPFGFVIDYMTYGGIYRDVYIDVKNSINMKDVFIHSQVDVNSKKATLTTEIELNTESDNLTVCQYIRSKNSEEYTVLLKHNPCKSQGITEVNSDINDVDLWDVENPHLYEIKTELWFENELLDEKVISFGFRKAEFKKDGFYLNNQKIKIRGLNRHQSYPYVGYAMPKSMQIMDADILKNELGLNAVRTSHYPQSHDFISRCDEIGLLVFTEIPGWQHIGEDGWKAQAVRNTEDMVKQYRNHTSIILWGVRINESKDDDEFYAKTNAVARKFDPGRPTAGVRAHKKSSLLEDVYTYNDFVHNGTNNGCEPKKNVTSNMDKAYMVSEYNGHMYPTKNFDCEDHRREHAMRHANVINAVAGEDDIAGSFGWCMADYNTHKDFGSGDRICYHGVMDMFRNPKMAASIYASQQEKEDVLYISSSMDIGEHPACNRGETWIYTNADSVKMYKNDRFIKEYTAKNSPYKNLTHGPILIDDYVGDAVHKGENFKPKQADIVKEMLNATAIYGLSGLSKSMYLRALKLILIYRMKVNDAVGLYNRYVGDWGGASTVYRFEAIKDGKVVKTVIKEPMQKVTISAVASNTQLTEEYTYDVAAVRINAVDEHGNVLPFFQEPLVLETTGPIEVIGEKIISLKGGMGGTYIRTIGEAGKGSLIIKNAQSQKVVINFDIQVK